jgi:glutathione peroxidase
VRQLLAKIATKLARPASIFAPSLRGTTDVQPLSESFYGLSVPGPDRAPVDLSTLAGRVALVVNVASECGFTPQYAGLQTLHEQYRGQGFTVLGFPSNEFGNQEPGSIDQIRRFAECGYGIGFPLFAKVQTRPGPNQSPAYRRLGESGHLPAWNFYKYVVGRDGQVTAVFPTSVPPDSKALRDAIEQALSV